MRRSAAGMQQLPAAPPFSDPVAVDEGTQGLPAVHALHPPTDLLSAAALAGPALLAAAPPLSVPTLSIWQELQEIPHHVGFERPSSGFKSIIISLDSCSLTQQDNAGPKAQPDSRGWAAGAAQARAVVNFHFTEGKVL
jgi:hypothetical protein